MVRGTCVSKCSGARGSGAGARGSGTDGQAFFLIPALDLQAQAERLLNLPGWSITANTSVEDAQNWLRIFWQLYAFIIDQIRKQLSTIGMQKS